MFKLIPLLLLVSCFNQGHQQTNPNSDLIKFRDDSNNVTCYRVRNFEGVSCIKD